MRTQEEILKRIDDRKKSDFFGFEWPEYINHLIFDNAKPFYNERNLEDAEKSHKIETLEETKEKAVDYMSFAWEKANNCRGISASRSLSHYAAWMWLLGYDDLDEKLEDYQYYGKDELVFICDELGIDHSVYDDGVRVNTG